MSPPPALVAMASHPLRWRLLAELGRSDRRVSELVSTVGLPQNLISYHLGQLRRAGLVTARRSTADGRDTYYAPDLPHLAAALVATGTGLHPGLRLTPVPVTVPAGGRVLFLCTGNSARSQMAEALTVHRSGGRIEAASAGSHPKPIHPATIRVLREHYGIDISGARSKHLDELIDQRFDRVITLCDRVREVCPGLPGDPESAHWSVPEPASQDGEDDAFVATAAELDVRIGFLMAALAAAGPPDRTPPEEIT